MADPTASVGSTLGHYRLLAKIGAGGMGVVFRAHDERLGRDVAIKLLPADSADDPTARARLLREARTASLLNHPHICTIHDVGEAGDQVYIAMELIQGETLFSRLAARPLAPEEVLRYGLQLVDALAHAHEHGVVHRDLKSANIILTAEGRAKILDFGLAKRVIEEAATASTTLSRASLTAAGSLSGTLAYMAPEQLRGRPADSRSDIWALGVVLFEMATAQRPFQASPATALAADIQYKEPVRPGLLNPVLSPRLEEVVLKCLEKKPEDRYQSARDLLSDIQALAIAPAAARGRVPRAKRARPRRQMRQKRLRSLVVLPLVNLSGDPEQEYFADGMTEALIADLARIGDLRIISRTSAMRYKHTDKSLPDIAGELKVDGVVEGSVLRAGQRVRITAQLIHAATDTHVWAESYERDLQDVLLLQSEVARAIAREIEVALAPEETRILGGTHPVNPEAYEACLKGRYHWYKLSPEHLDTALEYFHLALQKDPNYAPAYAGIADTWFVRGDSGILPPGETFPKVEAAALKALELDSTLGEVHVALGNLRFCSQWDWRGAEAEFRKAITLRPSSADARFFYADYLISMRRPEESLSEAQRALELDPFNFFFQCFFGWHLVYMRRYDAAVTQLRKAIRMEPDSSSTHMALWGAFHQMGNELEAKAAAEKFFTLLGDVDVVDALSRGFAESGYARAMRLAADTLVARSGRIHVPAVRIARLYAHAGERDSALDWLETAFQRHEPPLVHLSVGWDWDPLRTDARFRDLLRRMDLPSE